MAEWQPIETAPKDDDPVLLWAARRCWIGEWSPSSIEGQSQWLLDGHFSSDEPTHWQPLPEPPHD